VPSTFATGYRYALLGYTTVVDAATPPLAARHTLAELRDTPIVDAAFLVLMGNNLPLFELIRKGGPLAEAVAWWLEATGGYGVKLVNPGGVEMWKHGNRNVTSLDDEVEGLGVTPSTSTATTSGWRATGAPRSTPSRPLRAGARTSPTCSSTPMAGHRASGPARARRNSPSTSPHIPSTAPTSAR
jgi:hypothetical protein